MLDFRVTRNPPTKQACKCTHGKNIHHAKRIKEKLFSPCNHSQLQLQRLSIQEGMKDPETFSEVLEFLRYADEEEVIQFGRKYRAQPDSIQYVQTKLEYEKRQRIKASKATELNVPQDQPTAEEYSEMARMAGRRYPWMRYPEDESAG